MSDTTQRADDWELYNLGSDLSQAENLAAKHSDKPAQMRADFLKLAEDNKAFPIGAGNWLRPHPEDRIKTPYTHLNFLPKKIKKGFHHETQNPYPFGCVRNPCDSHGGIRPTG